MILAYIWILLLLNGPDRTPSDLENRRMLDAVNQLRSQGCYCGRKYMPAAEPLTWNDTLYLSAMNHAIEMHDFDFFAHYSKDGKNIGERLDAFEYPWQYAGENLGEGQTSFEEVLRDWLQSRSHCRMLMNPNMTEMAVARYKNIWVQHFGTKLPKGAVRKNIKESNG
ncbi:MAG: CAP domain-containing protein [Saprospiraceae bacterium]|nr:CAP domain-containing protein [Saprospiraceae bacterium]MBK8849988.1 CAP domain-containing protein [Saprospiraceae bacterium]MBK9686876.1 CAP domain-containing protein [Saprospiraceae bacterium]